MKSLQETGTRKRVSALIETLANPNRSRFYPVIDDSAFASDVPIGEILAGQTNHPGLNVIVSETDSKAAGPVELVKHFARERSKRASSTSFAAGAMPAEALFSEWFLRLIVIGDKLTMIDYMIGREFGGNYAESLEHWCVFLNALNKPLQWIIHTERSQCRAIQSFLEAKLGAGDVTVR